jgi:NAD(P)-dependent dehydrogenase (short-subunit alcohol dehydrogenase family)
MTPTAVVTGAATGIGAATAVALAEAGYAVALWDIDSRGLAEVANSVKDKGSIAVPSVVDVASATSIRAALDEVRRTLSTPTAVVSAAGIMAVHPFLELPVESWEATLRVNLTGTFLLLQACGAAMVEDGLTGAMVAVASVAARGPRPDAADYAASKAAVVSLVESAAVALAPHGVRVNAVCPGVVDTPMTDRNNRDRAARENVTEQEIRDALVARVPLGRMASPREIAAVTTRLLGADFGYVTGQALNVCGGLEFD